MKVLSRFLLVAMLLSALFCLTFSQSQHLVPGVDRWAIKTSLPDHPQKRTISINEMLALPNPIQRDDHQYDSSRIPIAVGPDSLKEGEIVTTAAWLQLVALEDDAKTHRDGDYHIQIRNSLEWADSCLIIEVPYPEFISDPALAEKCKSVREFIRAKLLNGKEPGTRGNKLDHPVYVTVTGQLFFDSPHVNGNPRGKRDMKSYTPWELHPIFSIKFAPKPK